MKPKVPIVVDGPELPDLVSYLWRWFTELDMGRGSNGFGPSRITWLDISSWSSLTGNDPEPWEVRALMRLDVAYLNAEAAKQPPKPST